MNRAIFATVGSQNIQKLLGGLSEAGFSESDISVLIPNVDDPKNLSLTQDVRHGVWTGGIVGAIAAQFGTIGTLLVTGVGPFLVAGPLLLAIGGAAVGGVVGGLVAGTGDVASIVGIPSSVVSTCEEDLREGHGLVMVEAEDARIRTARKIFVDAGADRIYERTVAA